MKKLIIINGTMGVGKTTVSRELYKSLDKSVWLDGATDIILFRVPPR